MACRYAASAARARRSACPRRAIITGRRLELPGALRDEDRRPSDRAAILENPLAVQQAEEGRYSPLGLVFPSPDGVYWRGSNFSRRVWLPARERAGFGADLRPHHLRHFYTTLMRHQGLPTAVTEQLLGHADERTHRGYTQQLDAYTSLVREASDRAFGAPAD